MKRISIIMIVAFATGLICSCTTSKVKKFAEEFATAVQSNDKATIAKMYPESAKADSLTISFVKDSVLIEEVNDTFIVKPNSNSSLSIVKTEEGDFKIADSHGIFAYSPERINFGLNTGWIKREMSDLTIAKQFSDTTFINYLTEKNVEQIKTKLVVKSIDYSFQERMHYDSYYKEMMSSLEIITATIINNSDYEIKGSDYEVTIQYCGVYTKKHPGKDIKPGEKHRFSLEASPQEAEGKAIIKFVASDADMLARYFKPKGDEYESYLRSPISNK